MKNYSCTTHNIHDVVDEVADGIVLVAYQFVAPVIITIGIFGNVLNLIVLRRPFLKSCTRSLLVALAITDLSVMITVVPMVFRLNKYHDNAFATAFFYAHIELFLTNVFIAASVLIVVCLTVERYLSVCHPTTTFKNVHTKRYATIGTMWCYGIAVTISFPLTVFKKVCIFDDDVNAEKCDALWEFEENASVTASPYWTVYLWISEVLVRLGPAILVAVLNVLILRKIRRIRSKRETFVTTNDANARNASNNKSLKYKMERRVGVLLRAIVLLFFVTMTPSSVLSLVYTETQKTTFAFQVFRAIANNLELANFALNFYVYFLCSKDFRIALGDVLKKCLPSRRDANVNDDDNVRDKRNTV